MANPATTNTEIAIRKTLCHACSQGNLRATYHTLVCVEVRNGLVKEVVASDQVLVFSHILCLDCGALQQGETAEPEAINDDLWPAWSVGD